MVWISWAQEVELGVVLLLSQDTLLKAQACKQNTSSLDAFEASGLAVVRLYELCSLRKFTDQP